MRVFEPKLIVGQTMVDPKIEEMAKYLRNITNINIQWCGGIFVAYLFQLVPTYYILYRNGAQAKNIEYKENTINKTRLGQTNEFHQT